MQRLTQQGYTYFGVLFAVMLLGLAMSGASLVLRIEQQREKEWQLLYVGQQYMNAIASYYNAAPGGNARYPAKLADLLLDTRYPTIKRHLRKPWRDPLTHSAKWGLIYSRQGGIAGIYSLARGVPLKRAGFGNVMLDKTFANKTSYQEWKFISEAEPDPAAGGGGKEASGNTDNASFSTAPLFIPMPDSQSPDNDNAVPQTAEPAGEASGSP